jgi:phosphoribosylformylglycinamidine synthase subunit PurQ / glutaminase
MMTNPTAIVLAGDGINCDTETEYALELAGFSAARMHISQLLESKDALNECRLLALPGGFSFGDEIASGKVLSIKLKHTLRDQLYQFVEAGKLVIGICNGFQVLTQMGLLPFSEAGAERVVTLTHNSGGRFINRWVEMRVKSQSSAFFDSLNEVSLPIRHGEGRLLIGSKDANAAKQVKQHAPLRYVDDVNGSYDRIAALVNTRGNVLGLMPHPEAFVRWTQHPDSGRFANSSAQPHGLVILKNARRLCG